MYLYLQPTISIYKKRIFKKKNVDDRKPCSSG